MSVEGTYLEKIIAAKQSELGTSLFAPVDLSALDRELARLPPTRDLFAALKSGGTLPRAIAEFKRVSPKEGPLREHANPREIAAAYVDAGATAISVLTDRHFHGSFDDLRAVRDAVDLPVLCKDFILSRTQILEARRAGADAVLLIATVLEPPKLRELYVFARDLGLTPLVETHSEAEIERALAAGARVIGVNARDLATFAVDFDRVLRLRSRVPDTFAYVAESGITSIEHVARLQAAKVDGFLVGSHLMRAEDPGAALAELLHRHA